jgi:predicted  nucleic acid-binding Zn-ribbon protein
MKTAGLLALQETDTSIDRLSARQRVLESGDELTDARAEADAAERDLGELGLQLDTIGRDQSKLEHEIDSLSQKAAAEQKRLYDGSVVNAKELTSLQHEIDNLHRRRSDREDEMLGLMEVLEELESRAAEARARSEGLRARVDAVASAAAEDLATARTDLERLTAERAAIASEIDPEVLELYDDLRHQKKGVGAAALIDGVCQGCHEQLSAMELDKLKHAEGVARCEYCRRILIF